MTIATATGAAVKTLVVVQLLTLIGSIRGFTTRSNYGISYKTTGKKEAAINPRGFFRESKHGGSVIVGMGGVFDDIQNFFSDPFGNNNNRKRWAQSEDAPGGDNCVMTIPVKEIKPGGLRLFLMFYLMGVQNTPDRNSWKADQPTQDEYVIDLYFHDRSAMLNIELKDNEIVFERIGSVPSTAYVMQETVILEGILDELHQCAFDENIEEENRLLLLHEPKDAIEKARDSLAFG